MAVMALLLAGAGCVARPTGDFGRAQPSFTHDTLMQVAGNFIAKARKEPVSWFNQTDQEDEMHNRVWRFLVAEHTNDWFYNTAVELQRTRILPGVDQNFSNTLYYNWLKQTRYRSSPVRYGTISADILADTDTIPGTFIAICKVIEIDRQRAVARDGLGGLEPEVRRSVGDRKAENDGYIAWFVRALTYRQRSYDYALNHLLVETPDRSSVDVDRKLAVMAGYVARASRGDFCANGANGQGVQAGFTIPSRFATQKIDNEVIAIK